MASRYQCLDCGKTYIGPKIEGGMVCNCTPAKTITKSTTVQMGPSAASGPVLTLRPPLTDNVLSSEAASVRNALCTRYGIANKSHKSHGSNFSSNQTLANLIGDIVAPVTGELRTRVRQAIIDDYSYDIDSGTMTA